MVHHNKQIRTYFFLKVRSDFLFVMKSPVSAMVYSASGWRCCEWDKVHKEIKRFPALFKRHILTTFFLSSLETLFFLDIQNAPFSAFSVLFSLFALKGAYHRESKGLLFVFAIGKSMDGLRGYRSGRFGFQTPTSAWLFADSHGFLFVGGLLAGWTFSPHLAAATE